MAVSELAEKNKAATTKFAAALSHENANANTSHFDEYSNIALKSDIGSGKPLNKPSNNKYNFAAPR